MRMNPDKISNNKLLQDTNQESIDNTIRKRRWRWLRHVMRMKHIFQQRLHSHGLQRERERKEDQEPLGDAQWKRSCAVHL